MTAKTRQHRKKSWGKECRARTVEKQLGRDSRDRKTWTGNLDRTAGMYRQDMKERTGGLEHESKDRATGRTTVAREP
jgi:hypothetical protein